MVQGRRKQEWFRTGTLACAIANTWRSKHSALKIENFPYCSKPKLKKATRAEMKAFAILWYQN